MSELVAICDKCWKPQTEYAIAPFPHLHKCVKCGEVITTGGHYPVDQPREDHTEAT